MADGDGNNNGPLAHSQVVGVVVGSICVFAVISLVPIVLMWYIRRFPAPLSPPRIELSSLGVDGFVRQVSVEGWLREQGQTRAQQRTRGGEDDAYGICPICLSPLIPLSDDIPAASLPYPEPALVPRAPSPGPTIGTRESESTRRDECRDSDTILVLRRCNHAFHFSCLVMWFEYRRHKCPVCQTPYFPMDPLEGP